MARFDDFRSANLLVRLNRWAQVLLGLLLAIALTWLGSRSFWRFDLTTGQQYALAAETLAEVRALADPVEIVVTIPEDSPNAEEQILYRYVRNLLDELVYASVREGEPMIRVEYVDLFTEVARAAELSRQYGLEQPNLVLVAGPQRQRILTPSELMEFGPGGKPVSFRGEQAVASALVEARGRDAAVLYFVQGHGELKLDDVDPQVGLSTLASELRARNLALRELDLSDVEAVPEDADMVIIAGPQGPLLPEEVEKLRVYLAEQAGRVFMLLRPGAPHGLSTLLAEWGLRADDMIIHESGGDFLQATGSLLIRQFADHPVTRVIVDNPAPVVIGEARPVRIAPAAASDERLILTQLMGSSPNSWAERAYDQPGRPVYDPRFDLLGPVSIAAVSERRAPTALGIAISGGRLAVFGTPDMLTNNRFTVHGNYTLVLHLLNWMLDRDNALAIPPRPIARYQFALSQDALTTIFLSLLALPAGVALLGATVFWLRRRP